jgi:hypothetical protein
MRACDDRRHLGLYKYVVSSNSSDKGGREEGRISFLVAEVVGTMIERTTTLQ